jgi:hypothetical protein
MGNLRSRSSRSLPGETTSHAQSGGSSRNGVAGTAGSRERSHPARSGTKISLARCSSGSKRMIHPPGPSRRAAPQVGGSCTSRHLAPRLRRCPPPAARRRSSRGVVRGQLPSTNFIMRRPLGRDARERQRRRRWGYSPGFSSSAPPGVFRLRRRPWGRCEVRVT